MIFKPISEALNLEIRVLHISNSRYLLKWIAPQNLKFKITCWLFTLNSYPLNEILRQHQMNLSNLQFLYKATFDKCLYQFLFLQEEFLKSQIFFLHFSIAKPNCRCLNMLVELKLQGNFMFTYENGFFSIEILFLQNF